MNCPIEYDFSCMVITLHSCARPVSAACLSAGEVWLVMKNFCCFLLTHRLYLCLRLTRSLWLLSLLTIDLSGTTCMTLYHSGVTADSKEPSGSQKVGLQLLTFFCTTTRIQFSKYCYFYCWNEMMQLCRKYVCTGPFQAWQYGYLGLGIAHMWPALPAPACN